jgi:hypothetical protein
MRALMWLNGWRYHFRSVWMAIAKKHGANGQPFPIAWFLGRCTRFIVYGQNYKNSRCFRQQRKFLERHRL